MSRQRILTSPATAWIAAAIGAWLVAGACRSAQVGQTGSPTVLPTPSVEGLVEEPAVRVGILPNVQAVTITAGSGVRVLARSEREAEPRWRPLDRARFRIARGEGRVHLMEGKEDLALASIVPADAGEILSVNGQPYRGIFEVRPSAEGGITVVNVVYLEDYLRGVVPNELSPRAFPRIEAHKAQAVAARTWVLSHLGDYSSKGYDVCATQACQVYRGQATEQRLTDRAVEETRGIIATWRGRPIHAYYTSTCGGHTEDGDVIFDDRAPYLRGVVCAPESRARHTVRSGVEPRRDLPGLPDVPRSLAVLESLGIVDDTVASAEKLSGVPGDDEVRTWMGRLKAALERSGCSSAVTGGLARRASFAEFAVGSVCWAERAASGEHDHGDLAFLADGEELVGDAERQAAALLLHEGILTPGTDGTLNPDGSMSRGEVLTLLARLAESVGTPEWRTGEFAGLANGRLTLLRSEATETLDIDAGARLFRCLGDVHAGARELTLRLGDEVDFVAKGGHVLFLEVQLTAERAALDRASRHDNWKKRLTPGDVARRVARYGDVGQVRDIVPRQLGVSGRVVELEVQGTAGDLLLRGLKVRRGLGLKENLFVIDRETNGDGAVERFVISGKGWGHGVGLCQVGAFGMAQAGSTFEGILEHYYTGISLANVLDEERPRSSHSAS